MNHMSKKIKWISVTFLLVLLQTVSAQETLTLKQAISYALQNKADAQKAKLEVLRGDVKIKEAKSGALPQISASGSVQYNAIIQESALQMNDQLMVIKMGQPWNTNATVSLYQALFDQRVFTGLKAAKTTREFYQINAKLTNEQIIERVATAYYQVFVTEQKLENIV